MICAKRKNPKAFSFEETRAQRKVRAIPPPKKDRKEAGKGGRKMQLSRGDYFLFDLIFIKKIIK